MSANLRKAALAYQVLSKRDRQWLLDSLGDSQRQALLEAVKQARSLGNLDKLSFSELLSVYDADETSQDSDSENTGFNELAFHQQVNIGEKLSVESIWALSYWDQWRNKESVLSALSDRKKDSLKAYYKQVSGVPNHFVLNTLVEYVEAKAAA